MDKTLQELEFNTDDISQGIMAAKIFTGHQSWFSDIQANSAHQVLETFLNDSEVQQFLQINRYMDILWFNKNAFELLLSWMAFTATVGIIGESTKTEDEQDVSLAACFNILSELYEALMESNYQVEKLVEIVRQKERELS